MRSVVVLSGVSGSGKSEHAKKAELAHHHDSMMIVSADHYFIGPDDVYRFDPTQLSKAHGECFKVFIDALRHDVELVIVDNTNTTTIEIAPYMLAASAYCYEAEIVIMNAREHQLEMCAKRNKHGVSLDVITKQHQRMWDLKNQLPPWWNRTDFLVLGTPEHM